MASAPNVDAFFGAVAEEVGKDAVDTSFETVERYGENTMPGGQRRVAGVIFPASTAEVQTVVRLANRFGVALYPLSTGNNIGLGSRSPVRHDQIVVDLGRRMKRIIEVDEQLGLAIIEPGVSFQMLHDELVRLGDKFMISATSGPPHGGIIGNALDKGAGYGPLFDHFAALCGLELVLGTGEILRTGDGSLDSETIPNWHVSKYSFGPVLDGLFAQSNYGIVTRAAVWLLPRPPVIKSFHFVFPEDGDIGSIVELIRPLKMSNFVPTLFRVANDLYALAPDHRSPEYQPGKGAISSQGRRAIRVQQGLGAWQVSAAFYGASEALVAPMIDRVKAHFGKSGNARYVSHEEAQSIPALQVALDSMAGRPSSAELGMLTWRPGGGNTWFLPGMPMTAKRAASLDAAGRDIYERFGMDYIVMHVASARFARGLHVLVWNKNDADENRRADECYRALMKEFAASGVGVGRAPIDYHAEHMNLLMPSFKSTCDAIKAGLDPNGVIAPGKYGIGA